MPEIIVIGSGVIGLSAARRLQADGYSVRIISRELPLETTSVAAGAVWSGSGQYGAARTWAARSLANFLSLTDVPGSGVTLQRTREVYPQPVPDPWYRDRIPFFEHIPASKLPNGLTDGYLMDVPMVAPPIYLQSLYDQFVGAGGVLEKRQIDSLPRSWRAKRPSWSIAAVWARGYWRMTPAFTRYGARPC